MSKRYGIFSSMFQTICRTTGFKLFPTFIPNINTHSCICVSLNRNGDNRF